MKRTNSFLTAIFLAGVSSLALAQHGGHSGGGFGTAAHDQSVDDMQKKMKIQATDEQRSQLRTCVDASERLLMLAADVKKPAGLSEPGSAEAHQRWNEVLRRAMQGHHQAFLESLNADQQAALKGRLQKMDKTWSELSARFETIDRDLAEAAPDAKRLSAHAKELEKSLKKWQKQHRELGSEIGVEV
jgi:chromosome segregation ATPase